MNLFYRIRHIKIAGSVGPAATVPGLFFALLVLMPGIFCYGNTEGKENAVVVNSPASMTQLDYGNRRFQEGVEAGYQTGKRDGEKLGIVIGEEQGRKLGEAVGYRKGTMFFIGKWWKPSMGLVILTLISILLVTVVVFLLKGVVLSRMRWLEKRTGEYCDQRRLAKAVNRMVED